MMLLHRSLFFESGIFLTIFDYNGSKYEFCNNFFIKKKHSFSNIAEGSSIGFESSKGGLFKKWQDITFYNSFLTVVSVSVSITVSVVSTIVSSAIPVISVRTAIVSVPSISGGISFGFGFGFRFSISRPLAVVVVVSVSTGISVSVVSTVSQTVSVTVMSQTVSVVSTVSQTVVSVPGISGSFSISIGFRCG